MNISCARSVAFQQPAYLSWRWLFVLIAIVLAPSPVANAAEKAVDKESEQASEEQEPPRHAYKLGDFRIKNFRPVEREKATIQFTVWVEVEDGDHLRFEEAWKTREHRVRNQIITSARLVPPNEFEDPTLHALRRRIYLRLHRAIPELPLGEVFISDFSYLLE